MPRVGITMGDPRGVGPELARIAIGRFQDRARFVFFGDPRLVDNLPVEVVRTQGPAAARDAVEESAEALRTGAIDAVVTGPVSKACFGGEFPGHTELYAARLGVSDFAMLLAGSRLRVVPATTHLALQEVARALTTAELCRIGRLVGRELARDFGIAAPRLAFAGLNPHAGDGGLFGDEEGRIIAPAVAELHAEGVLASGPWSPDSVYWRAARGDYDCVIGPYHDQALIPFKILHFTDGVNITLGLPRPRVSPDHGPAYDLAGTGKADPASMLSAVETALRLAQMAISR
jgi:4-hydroxythreonine-4-phosphate dehydrogenase